jgi:hypothetical protein
MVVFKKQLLFHPKVNGGTQNTGPLSSRNIEWVFEETASQSSRYVMGCTKEMASLSSSYDIAGTQEPASLFYRISRLSLKKR